MQAIYLMPDWDGVPVQVIYIEACESGSIFQGVLSDALNIYATTASNAQESSWGTYCPGMAPAPPEEFNTCLGDLYSVAFLENRRASSLLIRFFVTKGGQAALWAIFPSPVWATSALWPL